MCAMSRSLATMCALTSSFDFVFVVALLAMVGGISYNSPCFARQRVKRQITRVVRREEDGHNDRHAGCNSAAGQ